MPVLGITGGIATGKSSFTQALQRWLPAECFDADAAAHELLAADASVQAAVHAQFGETVFNGGLPDRAKLREVIFAEPARRAELEAILHPAIRQRWMVMAAGFRERAAWLYVDIPLLYETGAEKQFDRVAVVACSGATQRARLREQRGMGDDLLEKIIGAQGDLGFKMREADHVIWNDSTVACLDGQAELLAGSLRNSHV